MKAALVTGATRGIGRTITGALLASGWHVFALGRDHRVLDEMRAQPHISPLAADLTDRDTVRALVAELQLTALIHTAQLSPPAPPSLAMDEAEVDALLEVNLSASIHLTRAVISGMARRRQGQVLFVLGAGDPEGNAVAQAARAGVRAFATHLADEVARSGITVGVMEPGAPDAAAAAVAARLAGNSP